MQRLDNEWMMRSSEVPLLKRKPSDYIARDVLLNPTDGDGEQPRGVGAHLQDDQRRDAADVFSDYPHWDMDLPSTIYDLPFLNETRSATSWAAMRSGCSTSIR